MVNQPKFLMTYLNIMQVQKCVHTAIQEHYFDMRLYCWEYFPPNYFALNKKYVRYDSFFVESLKKKLISCIEDCLF